MLPACTCVERFVTLLLAKDAVVEGVGMLLELIDDEARLREGIGWVAPVI